MNEDNKNMRQFPKLKAPSPFFSTFMQNQKNIHYVKN